MSRILSKLIRLSKQKNTPIIVYDENSDTAAVFMDLAYYERNFLDLDEAREHNDFEIDEIEKEADFEDTRSVSFHPEGLLDTEQDDFDFEEQSNKELALWKAKREEKEREEIAKVLEEELQENPPADPFEEDFVRSPEWHRVSEDIEAFPVEKPKIIETPKEPSYHPVINSVGSLSWSDWTNLGTTTPVPYKNVPDIILQEEAELQEEGDVEAVFLEEPI